MFPSRFVSIVQESSKWTLESSNGKRSYQRSTASVFPRSVNPKLYTPMFAPLAQSADHALHRKVAATGSYLTAACWQF
eukprot:c19528_g1_i8 orf=78-311(+)